MQKKTTGIIFSVLMGIVLPSILMQVAQGITRKKPDSAQETIQTEQTELQRQTTTAEVTFNLPVLMADGTTIQMDLEDYITGVVLAEMPADFEREALKAQAVVARTYALKGYFGKEKHPGRAICTDPSCCQAYCPPDDYLASGGTNIDLQKVADSVSLTNLEVLTFQSELIDATYFSCSGGRTEDARAVWGAEVPYLRSVDSPGEEDAAHYMDTVFFTLQEFADCLQIDKEALSGNWIGDIKYTVGGGVENIFVCGKEYTGTQIRKLLGLRSTAFVITAVGNTVTITTKGFGHRVGMSQYGADAMAVAGKTYAEILAYYYQGTALEEFAI